MLLPAKIARAFVVPRFIDHLAVPVIPSTAYRKLFVLPPRTTPPDVAGDTEKSPAASPLGGNDHLVAPVAASTAYIRLPTPTITESPEMIGWDRGATVVRPYHLHANGMGPSTARAAEANPTRQIVEAIVLDSMVLCSPLE
jgi:hypothetical protein